MIILREPLISLKSFELNNTEQIRECLFALSDSVYRDFQSALIPSVDKSRVIGVRIPVLRRLALEIAKSGKSDVILDVLPHKYYEEDNLHAFLIEQITDFNECIRRIDSFLPFVDNWATCDSMNPKIFKSHIAELEEHIFKWLASDFEYEVRYAVGALMRCFLDDHFSLRYLDTVANVGREEYYVKMMVAWYFATALSKQYEATVGYFERRVLDKWTHNKAIQKAIESFRISTAQKEYLRKLKI